MPNDSATPEVAKTAVAPRPERAVVHDEGTFLNLMDTARFEHLQRVSKVFANSSLVPEHFRGKEADCFIAVEMAMRLGLHPFNLMQSLYVVHGKPGIEAKMAIALLNSRGPLEGPLQFTLTGEGMKRQCTASGKLRGSGRVVDTTVTMEMAKAEGWIDKAGSKWKTLPDLMLQYRSASFFARLYAPEVIFGMQTVEELHDATPAIEVNAPPERAAPRRSSLRDRIVEPELAGAASQGAERVDKDTGEVTAPLHEPDAGDLGLSPRPTGGTSTPGEVTEEGTDLGASGGEPPIPFADVLSMAKRATTSDQADILLDTMNGAGYSAEQVAEVKQALTKSGLIPAPAKGAKK